MGDFQQSRNATADGSGLARCFFGVGAGASALIVQQIVLNVTPAVPRPRFNCYRSLEPNTPGGFGLLGSKRAGDQGTLTGNDVINASEVLVCEWVGAAPGAVCIANVIGTTREA